MGQKQPFIKKAYKYEAVLQSILAKHGYMVGNDLKKTVKRRFGVSDENARKIIQRGVASKVISSSSPFTFGKGQFIYLDNTESLSRSRIKDIAFEFRPPLYRLMEALDENNGVISYYEGLKITASPIGKSRSKVNTLDELVLFLSKLELISIKTDENSVKYILWKEIDDSKALLTHHSKMLVDSMFIQDILRWMNKNNIIDNLKIVYRNRKTPSVGATHNGFVWDAYAYTKSTGVNEIRGKNATSIEKQTLVVFDIVISRDYGQLDLDGFIGRIQIVLNSVKTGSRRVMPIVIYKTISEKTYNTLSSLGFLCFDVGVIYGARIYEVIEKLNLIKLNEVFVASRASDSGDLGKIIEDALSTIRVSGNEDNLSNIKGDLFESLLYPLVNDVYGASDIEQGKTLSEITADGTKEYYEYDYIIRSSSLKEIIIIELKGYPSTARIAIGDKDTKNTLSWFFGRTLPFAKRQFKKEIEQGVKIKACYITSAGFFEDGKTFLTKLNEGKLKPQRLKLFYDGQELIELLKERGQLKTKSIVEKYYVKNEK